MEFSAEFKGKEQCVIELLAATFAASEGTE